MLAVAELPVDDVLPVERAVLAVDADGWLAPSNACRSDRKVCTAEVAAVVDESVPVVAPVVVPVVVPGDAAAVDVPLLWYWVSIACRASERDWNGFDVPPALAPVPPKLSASWNADVVDVPAEVELLCCVPLALPLDWLAWDWACQACHVCCVELIPAMLMPVSCEGRVPAFRKRRAVVPD